MKPVRSVQSNAACKVPARANGNTAVRNSCPVCASLVFGGEVGKDTSHTIYAGTLDDPSLFHPTVAIFTRGRPDWAVIPPALKIFERSPQDQRED